MADSNNARGSARANGRKSARKSSGGSLAPKGASKERKTVHTKAPAPEPVKGARPAAALPSASPRVAATLPTAERNRMIAEAAYYRAQRRGFAPGNPHQDWLDAEAEIDAMLLRRLADD